MSISTRIRAWFSPEDIKRAQQAEAQGDLAAAAVSWQTAGRYADAVRVMLLRAQQETDAHRRGLYLAQATNLAPVGDPARHKAWRVRAQFLLELAHSTGNQTSMRRLEMLEAGQALRELGDGEVAAQLLHLAGDMDGEISALAEAGAIQQLEDAVARQRKHEEKRTQRALAFEQARDLISVGRRREAYRHLQNTLQDQEAEDLRTLMQGLLARRPHSPAFMQMQGLLFEFIPGNPIVLGRNEGELRIPVPVVSRKHLEFIRRDGNDPWVSDLGGRNGTTIRGARLESMPVGQGLDMLVGNALPLKVRQCNYGGVLIELPGRNCWLPLGPVHLSHVGASFSMSSDGWLDCTLDAGQAVILGDLRVDGNIQLLMGDELFDLATGQLLFRVIPGPEDRIVL